MEDFGACADGADCLYVGGQYDPSHCGAPPAGCRDLDEIFPPEEAMLAAENEKFDFSRITRDPVDPQMAIWAHRQNGNAAILSSDKNLLQVCSHLDIPRACFKAALHALNSWYDGSIFKEYNVTEMFRESGDNQNPFFHYKFNTRCEKFCRLEGKCLIHSSP